MSQAFEYKAYNAFERQVRMSEVWDASDAVLLRERLAERTCKKEICRNPSLPLNRP